MSTPRLAIVFCAHHKPWLMMSSLLTLCSQDRPDADIFVAYNVGNGAASKPSYETYRALQSASAQNLQLSPFDPRVREVSQIRGHRLVELEYENDHSLDSGTWYKFIRDGRWRDYDYTLFVGEGTLFAHPHVLSGLLTFATRDDVHFVASGHEKRRIPRQLIERLIARTESATAMDRFHNDMVGEAFGVFARDPEFRAVYEAWGTDFPVETEHHVPPLAMNSPLVRRVRSRIQKRWGPDGAVSETGWVGRLLRELPMAADRWASRLTLAVGGDGHRPSPDDVALAFAGGSFSAAPIAGADQVATACGVGFHRVTAPEWFGCATNHLMSRSLLERFSRKLDEFHMYDVLDLPFAGTPLEVIWGFLPNWLGVDKWFTNGFHRVRKNFATYQREDNAQIMASYINRYHRGRLVVDAPDELLSLRHWRGDLGNLRDVLPPVYFSRA